MFLITCVERLCSRAEAESVVMVSREERTVAFVATRLTLNDALLTLQQYVSAYNAEYRMSLLSIRVVGVTDLPASTDFLLMSRSLGVEILDDILDRFKPDKRK